MDAAMYSRVVALLEEAKDELSLLAPRGMDRAAGKARIHQKITDAQNLLMGRRPTNPEDN